VAAVSLDPEDLTPFANIPEAKALAMIQDALALAARVAPCILEDAFLYDAAARAILRGAVLRWLDAGTGALQQQSVDDYSQTVDTRQQRRGMFWPSEIQQLQDLCKGEETSGAYAVDMVSAASVVHADICALNFGAEYCSCGAVLTQNLPLYENL
jgi:hypothetical protein